MDELDQSRSIRWEGAAESAPQGVAVPRGEAVVDACVGRERELADLRAQYERAVADGSGRVVYLFGPAGIGKSRLTTELLRRFRQAGVPAFEGSTRERAAPYQPVIEIAQGVLSFLGDLGARGDALGRLSSTVRALRGQIDALRRGSMRTGVHLSPLPGPTGRLALFERVRDLCSEIAQVRPPVFVIHDLHLADGATLALVEYLARTLAPAPGLAAEDDFAGLLVVTATASTSAPTPAWLEESAHVSCPLGGLDQDGVRAFLASPEVSSRLLAATDGHPRRLAALLASPAPDADALAGERLAQLTPGARQLAQALAVLGRPAAEPLALRLESALRLSPLGEASAELADSALFARGVTGGELRLGFAHAGEREAVLAGLGADETALLHRIVGDVLDDDDPAARAEHLIAGRAGEVAVDAALAAGEILERTFAFERAITLYRAARAATTRAERRALLDDRLAALYEMTGDYVRALEVASAAAPTPESAWRVGHLELLRGDHVTARASLERARTLAQGDPALYARVDADLAECHFQAGAHDEARAAGAHALDLAPDVRTRLHGRNALGKVALERGDYLEARRLFGDNLADARRAGLAFDEARAHVNLGIAALREGSSAEAEQHYRAGLAVATQHGDVRHRGFCLQNLGVLAQWRRDYDTAHGRYQEAARAFKRTGNRAWLAWVALDLGDLYVGLGAVERAETMLALAARLSGQVPPATTSVLLDGLAGRIAAARGDAASARTRLEAARETARRIGYRDEEILAEATLARLEVDAGDAEAALARLAPLPSTSPRLDALVALVTGEAMVAAGRLAEATVHLGAAAQAFSALSDDEGQLRAAAASALAAERAGDSRAALRHRRRVHELDEQLRRRVPAELAAGYGAEPWRRALVGTPVAPVGPQVSPSSPERFPKIVGQGPEIGHLFDVIERVAPSESLVLVRGESGTGKELVAEAIHELSARRGRPFVRVNCGALVDSLLLSELFGHERGAFTGALSRRKGRFELADGGTLFLDEIGDISPQTQVALLRVLQSREFERVGGTQPIRVDVRIVCATNRDLEAMVREGRFREDLYYRLKGVEIELPPLRARLADLPALAQHFLAQIALERHLPPKRLAASALAMLARHSWPGNVRELENLLRSASLFVDGDEVDAGHLSAFLGGGPRPGPTPEPRRPQLVAVPAPAAAPAPRGADGLLGDIYKAAITENVPLRELKRRLELECITRALHDAGGNITRAAERLGMKRPRLSQLLKEHGIGIGQRPTPEDEE